MKTAISLIVSTIFAYYTGTDFVTLYTVALTVLDLYDFWKNDTDDENASH